jgi:hypothetical protein
MNARVLGIGSRAAPPASVGTVPDGCGYAIFMPYSKP